ncbi:MAG: SagB/ThcOx family dehydrogenase [Candidatus Aureabacteria bacterium]|nr:SagB/ThcOx family dehydrogenase [Candidatus Auribacterota bacterium]
MKNVSQKDIMLPLIRKTSSISIEEAILARRSVREFINIPLELEAVSQLLWAAQGLTGPKGLRTAPSAGGIYPVRIYVVSGNVTGLEKGLYQYHAEENRLSLQHGEDKRDQMITATFNHDWIKNSPAILVLAAHPEMMEKKYGEPAKRYIDMEIGHIAQNIHLQAVSLDLGTVVVVAFDEKKLKHILCIPESEKVIYLMPVGKPEIPAKKE